MGENRSVEIYKNYAELIELTGNFLLPKGPTRNLRVLFDIGATNNFINTKLVNEHKIRSNEIREFVQMGGNQTAQAVGETSPIKMRNGRFQHTSTYTVMDLGPYDVVLGMPFFLAQNVTVTSDGVDPEIWVPTPKGPRFLPTKIRNGSEKSIFRYENLGAFRRDLQTNDEVFVVYPTMSNGPVTPDTPGTQGNVSVEWVPPGNEYAPDHEFQTNLGASPDPRSDEIPRSSNKSSCEEDHINLEFNTTQNAPSTGLGTKKEHMDKERESTFRIREQTPVPALFYTERAWHKAGFTPKSSTQGGGDRPPANPASSEEDPLAKISRPSGMPGLEALLERYRDVFPADLPPHLPPEREINMRIPIKPGNSPPAQAPYRVHEDAKATIEETLKYLYEHGLARDSLSEYAAPVTLAKKPDGTWRFCVDYRRLNSITKEAKYPLPRIEDCLDHLKGARYFSKLDLRSGYWQVRIHPDDVEKSAFRTHRGHHEFLVVPFGLQGAPSCFQRLINHYLQPYLGKFVIVYLDDILIYSKTKEEHLEHLEKVLKILQEKQLFAKGSKCDLFKTRVSFLGFIINKGMISTDPSKIEAMVKWAEPTNVRELRSFLGLCNFYRKFVKDYAKIAKPLTNILQSTQFEERFGRKFTKTAPITLGPEEKAAFQALKDAMAKAPCLAIYDPTKRTEVWADASWEMQTVGAVLLQDHGNGLQPVAYMSKVLQGAQVKYPTFEQELLALKLAFDEWKHYLLPLQFIARTDHNGLKFLKTQKQLTERQWHWLAFFAQFYFELQYRPGSKMQVPDALSRRPHTREELTDLLRVCDSNQDTDLEFMVQTPKGPTKVCLNLEIVPEPDPSLKFNTLDVSNFKYKTDKDFGSIVCQFLNNESRPSMSLYSYRDGKLWWTDKTQNERLCVPAENRVPLLQEYHDAPTGGHFGAAKTYESLKRYFYWPKMKQSVEDYVTSCDLCQKNKTRTQRLLRDPKLPDIPLEPWEVVSVDFCGPLPRTKNGHDLVLACTCILTKESLFIPTVTTITAKGTAKLFVHHVFRFKGLPHRIISDRGPQFTANFWQEVWKILDTNTSLTAPYHPQSNPVERDNKTFEAGLRAYVNARNNDWDDKLILFEFAYNDTVNPSTGQTPFYLNSGRHPRTPAVQNFKTKIPAVEDFILDLRNEISAARDCLLKSQAYNADTQASNFQTPNFQVGDMVLLSTKNLNLKLPSKKLQPLWLGPLKILQIRGPNTVLVEVPPRLSQLEPLQNVQHLKPYKSRPDSLGPQKITLPPEIVDGCEEYEVEEILAHRTVGKQVEYLVRFKSYGPESDEWLPRKNLVNCPDILAAYHRRNNLQK